MLLKPDCIPCIQKMSIAALKKLGLEEGALRDLFSDILKIPSFNGMLWNVTSPEVIEAVMKKIVDYTGNPDPFRSEKKRMNDQVLAIYPQLKEIITNASNPLYQAVKLAIIGNAIDFMVSGRHDRIKKDLEEKLEAPLSLDDFSIFRERLARCRNLIVIGDNCGEIVCDKLLIELIKDLYDPDVTYIVRSIPTLNDATRKEAGEAGLDRLAEVIENGIDGPFPGTYINRCSPEVRELLHRADLIVSKGGGNFDSLDEEKERLGDITFMLLSKCDPYNEHFGVGLYHPILANYYK